MTRFWASTFREELYFNARNTPDISLHKVRSLTHRSLKPAGLFDTTIFRKMVQASFLVKFSTNFCSGSVCSWKWLTRFRMFTVGGLLFVWVWLTDRGLSLGGVTKNFLTRNYGLFVPEKGWLGLVLSLIDVDSLEVGRWLGRRGNLTYRHTLKRTVEAENFSSAVMSCISAS